MADNEDLLYTVQDGIGHVTFNRPQARNAMTFAMYDRLAAICAEAGQDPAMRALVLTGAGDKAFASGTDISQFREFNTPEDALGYEERIDRVLTALERCPVPTIAAVVGACTGGGAGMAAACDLRIATARLPVRLPRGAHAGQLPVDLQLHPAGRPGRTGGGEGHGVHRPAARRRRRRKQVGFLTEIVDGPRGAGRAGRRAEPPYRLARPADPARDQGGAVPHPRAHAPGGGPRPDPDVLHERGFPRGAGCVPDQAHAAPGRAHDRGPSHPGPGRRGRAPSSSTARRCTTGWSRRTLPS